LIKTLIKNWWLLGLSGILEAMISVFYLVIYYTTPDIHGGNGVVVFLSELAVAAGACTIAASIWRSAKGKSWLLVLNGLALSAYGLMALFWRGPLSFGFFALLLVVTAMTFGILALAIARILQRRIVDAWFFGLAGAASVGFALAFLALANHWIQLERRLFHPSAFLWLCFYFGFSAFCMLGLALRLHNLDTSEPIWWNAPTPLVNPKHAH
jgi:uncharacterized membrane protein HdeD (DUF308 family)